MTNRQIAVGFFGITRSLSHTIGGIEDMILGPVSQHGSVRVFSHFFEQREIENPRTGELGRLDIEEHRLLPSDWLRLEAPDECLSKWSFEALCGYGDYWGDGYRSLRNLVHQLHSLREVTVGILASGIEVALLCRPDLLYHDSFTSPLERALSSGGTAVYVPGWQAWKGGLNDRFALCHGREAIRAYGARIEQALTFCEATRGPLQAEQLVRFALLRSGIPVFRLGVRASRVRLGGVLAREDFGHHGIRDMRQHIALRLRWGF